MNAGRKVRLGILFGGRSGEYEVSLSSAASVMLALDPAEFEITAIGITRDGRLASLPELRKMLPERARDRVRLYDALGGGGSKMLLTSSASPAERPETDSRPEIIFPLLHGPYGEDGTVQGLLEIAGLPYIGCGVMASAVGMDKAVMKQLFLQAGLPCVPFMAVMSRDIGSEISAIQSAAERKFGYPLFCKPANLGSSVGVFKIHEQAEFEEAVRHSAEYDRKILIEKGLNAREIECAILGNDEPQASTAGEIIPGREFYDYDAKYTDPSSRLMIPAALPPTQIEEIRTYAIRAFEAIDGSGLARVDFFVERETGKIYVNEINTMPGFTPISMYSKLWEASGVSFVELIRRLVSLGFERHRERMSHRV